MSVENLHSPVAVFAFNRPGKLYSCLQSLELAYGSEFTSVHVFIDGQRHMQEKSTVDDVESIARQEWHFGDIRVTRSPLNLGLAKSILQGIDSMFEDFETVIVVEDDLEVARNFLTFMNDGLLKYVHSLQVCSIQGYTYPSLQRESNCFFLRGADCWGWATWKDRWFNFERDSKVLQTRISERNLERAFDLDGRYPYMQMLRDNQSGLNDSWAVRWHASNFIDNKLSLYPSHSLVNNTGDDGNGTHAGTSKGYQVNIKNSEIGDFPKLIRESVSTRNKLIKFHDHRNRKYWLSQIRSAIKRRLSDFKDRW